MVTCHGLWMRRAEPFFHVGMAKEVALAGKVEVCHAQVQVIYVHDCYYSEKPYVCQPMR